MNPTAASSSALALGLLTLAALLGSGTGLKCYHCYTGAKPGPESGVYTYVPGCKVAKDCDGKAPSCDKCTTEKDEDLGYVLHGCGNPDPTTRKEYDCTLKGRTCCNEHFCNTADDMDPEGTTKPGDCPARPTKPPTTTTESGGSGGSDTTSAGVKLSSSSFWALLWGCVSVVGRSLMMGGGPGRGGSHGTNN